MLLPCCSLLELTAIHVQPGGITTILNFEHQELARLQAAWHRGQRTSAFMCLHTNAYIHRRPLCYMDANR